VLAVFLYFNILSVCFVYNFNNSLININSNINNAQKCFVQLYVVSFKPLHQPLNVRPINLVS